MRRGRRKKLLTKQIVSKRPSGRTHTKEEMNLEMLINNINERAYRIWEREGKPQGRDFDIWLKAEKETFSRWFKK
jgi:hypothetical protein